MSINNRFPKGSSIWNYSNPEQVQQNLNKIYGNIILLPSNNKHKKYAIIVDGKRINFGQIMYEDYTKHRDETRRLAYLKRSNNIKGNWKQNPFSPNNLSRNLLW